MSNPPNLASVQATAAMSINSPQPTGLAIGNPIIPTNKSYLLLLSGENGQFMLSIDWDGKVEVNKQYSLDQVSENFWDIMTKNFNLVQAATHQTKCDSKAKILKAVKSWGDQRSILRSLEMTHYGRAAEEIADLIETILL